MSLLYKNPEDVTYLVDTWKDKDGRLILDFYADCGKHGTLEMMAGYKLTPKRLLEILQDRDDYKDDEL